MSTDRHKYAMSSNNFKLVLDNLMKFFGVEDVAVAQAIGCSVPCVTGWRQGTVVPHPLMVSCVLEELVKLCQKNA